MVDLAMRLYFTEAYGTEDKETQDRHIVYFTMPALPVDQMPTLTIFSRSLETDEHLHIQKVMTHDRS